MPQRQIVNIINFIRAVERYPGTDEDKREAVRNQIRIMDELSLKGTFLILYDVFEDEEYMRLMRSLDPERYEIGIWFEIEQFLCEASGLVWRGKTRWEQYCDTGYPMGYTKEERKRIIDEFFRRFKAEFGYYPRVFGTCSVTRSPCVLSARPTGSTPPATARSSTAPTAIPSGADITRRGIIRRRRISSCPHRRKKIS